jgi:hypothetical protein
LNGTDQRLAAPSLEIRLREGAGVTELVAPAHMAVTVFPVAETGSAVYYHLGAHCLLHSLEIEL